MKETAGAGRAEVRRAAGMRGASLLGAAQPTPALPLLYKRGGRAGGRKVTVKLVRNLRRDSKGSCTVLSAGLDKTRKREASFLHAACSQKITINPAVQKHLAFCTVKYPSFFSQALFPPLCHQHTPLLLCNATCASVDKVAQDRQYGLVWE